MADTTLNVVIRGDASGATAATRTVRRDLDEVRTGALSAGNAVDQLKGALAGLAGAAALTALVKSSLDAALQMERLQKMFTAASGSAALAAKEMEYVKGVVNRMGLDLVTTAESYGKFLAAIRGTTLEGEKGRKVFESVSNASAALGLRADETSGIFNALQQMMSKGKVQAEELRGQLGERLPGAYKLAADAMGMTTAELDKAVQSGKVLADDLLPKLAEQLDKKFGTAALSAQNQINLMNNALFEAKGAFGAALIPAFTDAVKAGVPFLNMIKEMIGGLQIMAIKAAGMWDRFTHTSQGNTLEEKIKNMAEYKAKSKQIEEETIADLMKRYTPSGSDYSAAEKLRQSANKPTKPLADDKGAAAAEKWASTYAQLRKEIAALNPIMSEHDKKLLDVSAKYAELERKKGANINKLRELKAQHLQAVETAYQTAEAIKATSNEFKEYLRIAGDESAWSQTADSVDEYHRKFRESVEDMDAATKAARDVANGIYDIERAFSEAGQSTAIETFINNLFKLKDVQNATTDINISMADSDPAAQQMAAIEERYRREAELKQQQLAALKDANLTETAMYKALSDNILAMASKREQDIANIQRKQSEEGWQGVVSVAQKAFPKLTGLDKAVTAAFKDHTKFRLATEQERAAGAQKLVKDETRSNLSMYSSYAGAAGAVFEGLAATQDTTSRAGFETAKAFNIAAAVMNTAMAITNALATVQPYPAAVAAAAMAGAMGVMQIATIASTTFGGTAQAPTVPSGSFGAGVSGGSSTVGTKIGVALQDPLQAASTNAMILLAESAESASMAIGDLADVFERIANTFEEGIGASLVSRAYGLYARSVRATGNANMLDDRVLNEGISAIIFDAIKSLSAASVGLGAATQAPAGLGIGVSAWGSWTEEAFRGMFETLLKAQMDEFAKTVPGLEEYAKAGENASDALIRLSTALTAFNDVAELAGITLLDGLSGANMASKIADVMGGQDEMTEAIESYFSAVFTDAEQSAREAEKAQLDIQRAFDRINADAVLQAKQNQQLYTEAWIDIDATTKQLIQIPKTAQQLADELNNVGIQVPKTREEFRSLVNSISSDISKYTHLATTVADVQLSSEYQKQADSAASTFAALMNVSEAFGTVMDAADAAAEHLKEIERATQDLDVRYLQATGQSSAADALDRQLSAQREIEQAISDNMGEAYINRLKEVLAAENAAVAADNYKAALESATTAANDAYQALQNSFNAQKKVAQDAYDAQIASIEAQKKVTQEAYDAQVSVAKTTYDTISKIAQSLESFLSGLEAPVQDVLASRTYAQEQLQQWLSQGITPTSDQLDPVLSALSAPSKDLFGTFEDYATDYYKTAIGVSQLSDRVSGQTTVAQQTLDTLKQMYDAQMAQYEQQKLDAKSTLDTQNAQYDAQMKMYQDQLNAAMSTTDAVKSVEEAVKDFEAAVLGVMGAQSAAAAAAKAGSSGGGTSIDTSAWDSAGNHYESTKALQLAQAADASYYTLGSDKYWAQRSAANDIFWAYHNTDFGTTNLYTATSSGLVGDGTSQVSIPDQSTINSLFSAASSAGLTVDTMAGMLGRDPVFVDQMINGWKDVGLNVPGFAVGTNFVPYDMLAQIHQGERIIPAADNYRLMHGNDEILAAIRELIAEVRNSDVNRKAEAAALVKNTDKTAKVMQRVIPDGDALAVRIAA